MDHYSEIKIGHVRHKVYFYSRSSKGVVCFRFPRNLFKSSINYAVDLNIINEFEVRLNKIK